MLQYFSGNFRRFRRVTRRNSELIEDFFAELDQNFDKVGQDFGLAQI